MRDLDNESPMPVDTVAEAQKMQEMANLDPRLMDTAAIETFTHLLAGNVVLLPYQKVIDLGGTLRSIALARFDSREGLLEEVEDFVARCRSALCRRRWTGPRLHLHGFSLAFGDEQSICSPAHSSPYCAQYNARGRV